MLIVTHNDELAGKTPRRLRMADGLIVEAGIAAARHEPPRFRRRRRDLRGSIGSAPKAWAEAGEAAPAKSAPAKPAAAAPNLKVVKLQFRGNRKVEDDAIKRPACQARHVLDCREPARRRARHLEDGFFEDVRSRSGGQRGQRRHLRAAREALHPQDLHRRQQRAVALEDQRGPRHREGPILDLARSRRTREDQGRLRREGLLHREVTTRSSATSPPPSTSGSTSTRTPRSRCREVQFVGNNSHLATPSCAARSPRRRGPSCRSSHSPAPTARRCSSATCCSSGALLGPRLRQGEGRQPARSSCRPTSSHVHHDLHRRGPVVPPGQGRRDRRPPDAQGIFPSRVSVKSGEIFNRSKLMPTTASGCRLLQGPRLRLRERHPDQGRSTSKPRSSDVFFEIAKGKRVTSTGSTSAATTRPATRSSAAR